VRPRRAGIRPGIYLSHFPGLAPLDFRVEAASTDPPTSRSNGGQFLYTEDIQKEGYTNKGFILGAPVGRESKGGQAGSGIGMTEAVEEGASHRVSSSPRARHKADHDLPILQKSK